MAILRNRTTGDVISEPTAVEAAMERIGVIYEVWGTDLLPGDLSSRNLTDAEKQAVLAAFEPRLAQLRKERGYQTADVVTLYPDTPNLDVMLAKFDKKHLHTDDEVRFIVQGRGVFTLFPAGSDDVIDAELCPGDFITVPANYHHLFTLTGERQVTAIRLFTDPAGWVAKYV